MLANKYISSIKYSNWIFYKGHCEEEQSDGSGTNNLA